MGLDVSRQRLYASVLILGACVLLFRTVMMISQGLLDVLVLWVSLLLIAEFLIDLAWLFSSINWWISKDRNKASLPLRLASAAIILHAVRVLIFVLGRVGPWQLTRRRCCRRARSSQRLGNVRLGRRERSIRWKRRTAGQSDDNDHQHQVEQHTFHRRPPWLRRWTWIGAHTSIDSTRSSPLLFTCPLQSFSAGQCIWSPNEYYCLILELF